MVSNDFASTLDRLVPDSERWMHGKSSHTHLEKQGQTNKKLMNFASTVVLNPFFRPFVIFYHKMGGGGLLCTPIKILTPPMSFPIERGFICIEKSASI